MKKLRLIILLILLGWMWYIVFEETNNIQQSSMPNTSSKSVIVVWAGMAWITAAKDLQEAGYDVTILEASPRIGGRLFTTQLSSGVQIDLWASRIHGIENNPIKDLPNSRPQGHAG